MLADKALSEAKKCIHRTKVMDDMATVGLILLAILFAAKVSQLIGIFALPLFAGAKAFKPAAPVLIVLAAALPMAGAMYLFVLLVGAVGRTPNVFMFLVPFLFIVWIDLDRINRAWTGDNRVRVILESQGDTYDPESIAKYEINSLIGDTVGLWLVFFSI
jgi:hypothetical protein